MQPPNVGIQQTQLLKVDLPFGENSPDFIFEAIIIRNRHKPFKSYGSGRSTSRNTAEGYIEAIERRTRHQPDNPAFGFLGNGKQVAELGVHSNKKT